MGGTINLTISNAHFSDPGSGVFSEVEAIATGNGGNINISVNQFSLNNQAQVSVDSTGLGQAGNMVIESDTLTLNQGQMTAISTQTGGGNINLVTDSIFLDRNSLISTSVLNSTGGGGNITIDNSSFIVGRDNSDLKADAVFGQGGNIQLNSQVIIFDLDSEITASSQFGVNGVVEINSIESDKKLGTVQLPDKISTPEAIVASSCSIPGINTFTVISSGGLAENPNSYLRGQTIWQDLRQFSRNRVNFADLTPQSISTNLNQEQPEPKLKTIVESQGWMINARGNIELIAVVAPITSKTFWNQRFPCEKLSEN